MIEMTKKERLKRAARGLEVDKIPSIGGWMNGVNNLAALAEISVAEYMVSPYAGMLKANVALDADSMVNPIFPTELDQVRSGSVTENDYQGIEPEAVVEYAATLPESEAEVVAAFDAAAEEAMFRKYFTDARNNWQGIEPMPNFWHLGGHFPLYHTFGYVAFLTACSLYPEAVEKIWWVRSLHSRESAKVLIPLYKELDLVPVLFCGEDLCTNRGPMLSPEWLRSHYFPTVKMITDPLVDAGIRMVHHCDGDVRPLLNDFIECGFSGFQGFQYEDGMDIYEIRKLRSKFAEEPIIFAGLSVTRTLPFGTVEEVRDEVDYFIDATDGGRGMFLFSSNVIGVEVPPANIRAAYYHVKTYQPDRKHIVRHTRWPWGEKNPE